MNNNMNSQEAAEKMCIELGYDAFQISAHRFCAPDHEPIQGRVLLAREYYKMQNGENFIDIDGYSYKGFSRRIGGEDCGHIAMPFSTKHSVRVYDDNLLETFIAENHIGCTINGRHYTIYQASLLMRKIEDAVRKMKYNAIIAQQYEDSLLRLKYQERINLLVEKYNQIALISNLSTHKERMVVKGFKYMRKG